MKLSSTTAAVGTLLLATCPTWATPLPSQVAFTLDHQQQPTLSLSTSLLSKLTLTFTDLFSPRLVQTSVDEPAYWTTELGKQFFLFRGKPFMDITDHPDLGQLSASRLVSSSSSPATFPHVLHGESKLKSVVFKEINQDGPRQNLAKFTSFKTRYYRSETGRQSQKWLLNKVKQTIQDAPGFSVKEFPHEWGQNSIILHIPGHNKTKTQVEGLTILGAHQDSTNFVPFFSAPGADDDGSGTVTIIESLRALLKSGWRPESDVEWHWYSAEEGGLLGSQAVAADYEKRNIKIKAMLQQDMTAYHKPGTVEVVGIVADQSTHPELTEYLTFLVSSYLDIQPAQTSLGGYASSDHASWVKTGVPAAFAIESRFEDSNHAIHSSRDTTDVAGFSFDHLIQFSKLSSAFVVEMAGWAK